MIDSTAFEVFGIGIKWYGLLIGSGMLLGVLLALKEAKVNGIKEDDIMDLVLWVLPAAIIGARAYYVLFEWKYYSSHLNEILSIRNGGLAIHGGVLAAFSVGYIFVKKRNLNFWKLADIVAPSLILGQAIGRWGNFINQEAHGGPVTEKFISVFPEFIQRQMYIEGSYYHPTFLYESIWNLLIFIFLIIYRRKLKRQDGELIALYFILYSIGRFFIEGLRTDSLMIGPLRTAQLISIVLILAGGFIFYIRRKKA